MEFGKVLPSEIDKIDFSLLPDDARNKRILKKSKENLDGAPQLHIGCAKWGRKDWVGQIYPKGTKEADFLLNYAKQFNSIELNATYYRVPSRAQVQRWKSMTGADFRFCPKFPESITHFKRLTDAARETNEFLLAMDA